MTTLHDFGGGLGTAFGHFLLGSHNFMVTALGSCVKWPLGVHSGSMSTKGSLIPSNALYIPSNQTTLTSAYQHMNYKIGKVHGPNTCVCL